MTKLKIIMIDDFREIDRNHDLVIRNLENVKKGLVDLFSDYKGLANLSKLKDIVSNVDVDILWYSDSVDNDKLDDEIVTIIYNFKEIKEFCVDNDDETIYAFLIDLALSDEETRKLCGTAPGPYTLPTIFKCIKEIRSIKRFEEDARIFVYSQFSPDRDVDFRVSIRETDKSTDEYKEKFIDISDLRDINESDIVWESVYVMFNYFLKGKEITIDEANRLMYGC